MTLYVVAQTAKRIARRKRRSRRDENEVRMLGA
jgi:hypothetical protein